MRNRLKSRFLIFSFITAITFVIGWGCDDNPFDEDAFDVGPEDEPNFRAFAAGIEGDVSIEVTATRDEREPGGDGFLLIGDDEFDFGIADAILSTDSDIGTLIPQSDEDTGDFVLCTPSFARFTVDIDGTQTTLQLNECEEDNPENPLFIEDGVLINPCTGDEVTDIEAFKGECLPEESGGEPGKDSIVLREFNGNCTADDPCIVNIDVVIFVPLFNPDIDPDIDLDDIVADIF
ncbi:MAG TPA: hypothetical protein VNN20_02020 [Thermodesulfobacteriota bacterium]|nr:hypothetical protein [Thermodesulfobacteriota bacterium]